MTQSATTRQVELPQAISILLAEDNAIDRQLVAALVLRDGHDVVCVANGRLAVEAASQRYFDLILMNKQMPEMDGLAAARAIRAGQGPCANVPIIGLTADDRPERDPACAEAGLTDILTKPLDYLFLAERLRSIASGKLYNPEFGKGDQYHMIAPLDDAKLMELEGAIGKNHVQTLLKMFKVELQKAPRIIALAVSNDNQAIMAGEAHALKGVALNIGASRIAAIARRIEQDDLSEHIAMLVGSLEEAANATIVAIDAWLNPRRLF